MSNNTGANPQVGSGQIPVFAQVAFAPFVIQWIPARLVYISSKAAGVSVKIDQIPQYLLERRRLTGWVNVNGVVWRQEFTVLSKRNKNYVYLLPTGHGGRALFQLYKQGIRQIFVTGLEPAGP